MRENGFSDASVGADPCGCMAAKALAAVCNASSNLPVLKSPSACRRSSAGAILDFGFDFLFLLDLDFSGPRVARRMSPSAWLPFPSPLSPFAPASFAVALPVLVVGVVAVWLPRPLVGPRGLPIWNRRRRCREGSRDAL